MVTAIGMWGYTAVRITGVLVLLLLLVTLGCNEVLDVVTGNETFAKMKRCVVIKTRWNKKIAPRASSDTGEFVLSISAKKAALDESTEPKISFARRSEGGLRILRTFWRLLLRLLRLLNVKCSWHTSQPMRVCVCVCVCLVTHVSCTPNCHGRRVMPSGRHPDVCRRLLPLTVFVSSQTRPVHVFGKMTAADCRWQQNDEIFEYSDSDKVRV